MILQKIPLNLFWGVHNHSFFALPPATHMIVQEIMVEPWKYAAQLRDDLGKIAIRDFSIILSFCNVNLIA